MRNDYYLIVVIPTCLYEVTEENHETLRNDSKGTLLERQSTAVESVHPSQRSDGSKASIRSRLPKAVQSTRLKEN
jgi:hypothetical protein